MTESRLGPRAFRRPFLLASRWHPLCTISNEERCVARSLTRRSARPRRSAQPLVVYERLRPRAQERPALIVQAHAVAQYAGAAAKVLVSQREGETGPRLTLQRVVQEAADDDRELLAGIAPALGHVDTCERVAGARVGCCVCVPGGVLAAGRGCGRGPDQVRRTGWGRDPDVGRPAPQPNAYGTVRPSTC